MARYAKGVEGVDHFYQPEDLFEYAGEDFDVRLSVLDDPPDQGLWVTVPGDEIGRPIAQILDELVIGRDPSQTEFIRDNMLELDEFPHLSDALDKMADIWHRFRAQPEVGLGLCVNNGPDDIAPEDSAREHMATCVWRNGQYDYMLLDLVLEPSELTLSGMLGERKPEFLLWLQGLVALYKIDLDPASERFLRKNPELEEVREQLFFHNLVAPGQRGRLEITQQGRRAIGRIIEEQDELIQRYDVFRDVVTRREPDGSKRYEFATLSGVDYRVAVYSHLGLDPFRSVFLLTLLAGELDEALEGRGWLKVIADEPFYEGILKPAVGHATLPEEDLAELVRRGEQHLARTQAQRARAGYGEQVLSRSGTIEAFPRGGEARRRPSSAGPEAPELPAETPAALGPPTDAAAAAAGASRRRVRFGRRPFGGGAQGSAPATIERAQGGGQASQPAHVAPRADRPSAAPGPRRGEGTGAAAGREGAETPVDDQRARDLAEADREIEEDLARARRERERRAGRAGAPRARSSSGPDDDDDGWL